MCFIQDLILPHFVYFIILTRLVSHGLFRDHWDTCSSPYEKEIGASRMKGLRSKACWVVLKGARIEAVIIEHTPESTMSLEIPIDTKTSRSSLSIFPLQPLYCTRRALINVGAASTSKANTDFVVAS